jgi:RND family efflux transporter MFP subunit
MGAAALATLGLGLAGCGRMATSTATAKAEPPAVKVTVVAARKTDVPIIAQPNGTTRALNEVTIRARVKGFLEQKGKDFAEGKDVKKDQLLLVIEERPFQVKVAQAKAVLDEAKATLRKARESKAREIAKAQVALDQTQLQLDRVEERRERNLLARKAASQEDYDRAKAKADKDVAQVQADTASLEQAVADYDINIAAAEANMEKARADLDAAEIELGYCRMKSPIDGRAGELKVKLGNLVGPATGSVDTTLLTIQQLDPMGVDLRPASRYLPIITKLVKGGLEVRLSVQGNVPHPYPGKVVFVDNTVDPTTSTVLVKAEVPNPGQTLLPGEYVKVTLNAGDYADVIVVPDQAVVEAQEGPRVLVVDAQNKVQVAIVKPLDTYEGLLALESGLEAGQKVIVEGIQLVRPGQTVHAEEADLQKFTRISRASETLDPLASPHVRIRGSEGAERDAAPKQEKGKQTTPESAKTPPPPASRD